MSAHFSPPKRPRLSLQIKPVAGVNSRASRAFAALDPKDPTTFNTLSNAYSGVIDRSTPTVAEPVTAINTSETKKDLKLRIQTPHQTNTAMPETPITAYPMSPSGPNPMGFPLPGTMTATPPLSAGPVDNNDPKVFTFAPSEALQRSITMPFSPTEPRTPRHRVTLNTSGLKPPYTHPRTLHSILRNSPLPPVTTKTPASPRRTSLRLQEKAAKRVGYNNPLTQTITTNKYTKSHIDLLIEEASPYSPVPPSEDNPEIMLDLALAYTGNETRDGGMTPGPFEEMRRRMAGLGTETPASPSGIRKRKRKEKKRRWVWTIGQEDDEEEVGGAMAAIRAAEKAGAVTISTPRPLVRTPAPQETPELVRDQSTDLSETESVDIIMSDTSSMLSEENNEESMGYDMDLDMKTPTVENPFGGPTLRPRPRPSGLKRQIERDDTPIPPDLILTEH